ncbi:MAG: zinc ribbon domain-containing protein [Dehalococcoidales bacterium]|jgi:putative FmdB family regulatory protein|nr:FmdB family transcriptional regulator [Dehalococcoidales bacterium]MDP6043409.1 zinc ribbon domain-containing protein [Dehalococcoidales bacterium]MDP6576957.1 zinc ribbon domain-containing protein [Dehalococcoidales bacterium]MDP6825167.1 zinc ribbon domain-containing protein [Dehalococcoidales bacterium]MDP7415844.1 zinc ribbon domain-containing protein [Dehalococcoidales bacterium]
MPIYEYICFDCGSKFELLRSLSEADKEASCSQCYGQVERVVSVCVSFSKDGSGESVPVAGTGSSCGSCGATSCSTCGV